MKSILKQLALEIAAAALGLFVAITGTLAGWHLLGLREISMFLWSGFITLLAVAPFFLAVQRRPWSFLRHNAKSRLTVTTHVDHGQLLRVESALCHRTADGTPTHLPDWIIGWGERIYGDLHAQSKR